MQASGKIVICSGEGSVNGVYTAIAPQFRGIGTVTGSYHHTLFMFTHATTCGNKASKGLIYTVKQGMRRMYDYAVFFSK